MTPPPQITLYQDPNYGGRSVELTTCGAAHLGVEHGFNDQVSSIRVTSGIWLAYKDPNYAGECWVLMPGEYPNPGTWRGGHDSISAVRPLPGKVGDLMAVLFSEENFGGRMVAFTSAVGDLKELAFNDQVSSAIVLGGQWNLYKDNKFQGLSWNLTHTGGPSHNGHYPSYNGFFDNNIVSAIAPGSGSPTQPAAPEPEK